MIISTFQKVLLQARFLDGAGQPATLPANATIAWSVNNPNFITLVVAADKLSAYAHGALAGTTNVLCAVTASGATKTGSLEIQVVDGLETVVIEPGTPEPK